MFFVLPLFFGYTVLTCSHLYLNLTTDDCLGWPKDCILLPFLFLTRKASVSPEELDIKPIVEQELLGTRTQAGSNQRHQLGSGAPYENDKIRKREHPLQPPQHSWYNDANCPFSGDPCGAAQQNLRLEPG